MKRRKFSHQLPLRPQHTPAQALRARLGLTQDDLADLLEVSRAAISMEEHGSRSLPWPQIGLLNALYQVVLPLPADPAPVPPAPLTADDRAELDYRRLGLRVAAGPLEKKLAREHLRLAQARCWQLVLPQLRAAFPPENPWAHTWLDERTRRAAVALRSAGGPAALLQVRLAAIAFEIAEITRLLGEVDAPPDGS